MSRARISPLAHGMLGGSNDAGFEAGGARGDEFLGETFGHTGEHGGTTGEDDVGEEGQRAHTTGFCFYLFSVFFLWLLLYTNRHGL